MLHDKVGRKSHGEFRNFLRSKPTKLPFIGGKLSALTIRKLCKERGIAINKLATMSDVKQSTLDNIVRGLTKNPGVKTLHKIALAFNMTLAEFLDFEELNEYSFDDDNGEE